MSNILVDFIRLKFQNNRFFRFIFDPINKLLRRRFQKQASISFKEYGQCTFITIAQVLSENKISFWPEFGTLLGIYRDNGFIPHDCDFDFGAFIEDRNQIVQSLINSGFQLIHSYHCLELDYVREDTFMYNNIGIDFFYFHHDDEKDSCYSFVLNDIKKNKKIYSIKVFSFNRIVLKEVDFLGVTITIPKDTADHLIVSYGPGFMVPDPNFKSINHSILNGYWAILE